MSNPYFRFKQFKIFHDKCAMKVGTDGVLLGAWTIVNNKLSALDIGTGSGLISLMLAQRNPDLKIEAIDIDELSSVQAKENITSSPFADQIRVLNLSLQEYLNLTDKKFDLIVSNPPFFINSLQSPSYSRTTARHTESLSPLELFECSKLLLRTGGILSVIYPFNMLDSLVQEAAINKLFPSKLCYVFPTTDSSPKRVLLEFTFNNTTKTEISKITLELERHVYTPEFRELTAQFYLDQ